MNHDPMCDHGDCEPDDCSWADGNCGLCVFIAQVRADERERMSVAIRDYDWNGTGIRPQPLLREVVGLCAAVARGEAS